MEVRLNHARFAYCLVATCAGALLPSTAAGQTIAGVLLDAQTERPIQIGLVMLFTEGGDSITASMTDAGGRFSVSSPDPGAFVLLASALGYAGDPVGVFELGTGSAMNVEYRLRPRPLPIDEIVVSLDRPFVEHHLVRNGFVRRLQRGLGLFITPYEIERSTALTTEQLMAGLPGLRVGPVYSGIQGNPGAGRGPTTNVIVLMPRTDIGEVVQIASPGGFCTPTLYLDGARVPYTPDIGITLNSLVDRRSIEAVEIYRRPVEIPVEFSPGPAGSCGVIVAWSKLGLAAGQRPSDTRPVDFDDAAAGALRPVSATGSPPVASERIRMSLDPRVAEDRGWRPPWTGVLVAVAGNELLVEDATAGRVFAVPVEAITALQVRRPKPGSDAWVRGLVAGAAMTGFTRIGLGFLCAWSHCGEQVANHWIPSSIAGVAVGAMMVRRGPGSRWVATPVPPPAPARELPERR